MRAADLHEGMHLVLRSTLTTDLLSMKRVATTDHRVMVVGPAVRFNNAMQEYLQCDALDLNLLGHTHVVPLLFDDGRYFRVAVTIDSRPWHSTFVELN